MAIIELEDRTAEALRAQANARNLPLETFLKHVADAPMPTNGHQSISVEEFDRLLNEVATDLPVLPVLTRAEIYGEHD